MTIQTEALKMALEALEPEHYLAEWYVNDHVVPAAITAIKEALAQPAVAEQHKQEPVGWMQDTTCGLYVIDHPDEWHCIPLYTTPPQRKPLTEDEAVSAVSSVLPVTSTGGQTHHLQIQHKYALEITRAIEAAHGIKE